MRAWEISLVDRPAIIVSVEDRRNLATEHTERVKLALAAQQRQQWWRMWNRIGHDPYWQITTEHRIHVSLVAGVKPIAPKPRLRTRRIGFHTTN